MNAVVVDQKPETRVCPGCNGRGTIKPQRTMWWKEDEELPDCLLCNGTGKRPSLQKEITVP